MPIHYIVILYPQQMVQMVFCDLSHTFHIQVTNVSQHVFVILLWGILTSPLSTHLFAQPPKNDIIVKYPPPLPPHTWSHHQYYMVITPAYLCYVVRYGQKPDTGSLQCRISRLVLTRRGVLQCVCTWQAE